VPLSQGRIYWERRDIENWEDGDTMGCMSDVSPSSLYKPAPEVEDGRETTTGETNELPLANPENVIADAVTDGASELSI
jgi:hypothetical protein